MHPNCKSIRSGGQERRIGGRPLVAVLILLPILYVLTVGPTMRLRASGTPATLPAIYFPIVAVCAISPKCEEMFTRYVNLWMPPGSDFGTDGRAWSIRPAKPVK